MKKTMRFKKGVNTIRIPFLLTGFTPWQDQIANEMKRFQKEYKYPKNAELDFTITNRYAELTLTKYDN